MDSSTAARLIDLNQDFYTRFGASFSATRHRLQPGVHRVLEMLKGDESILDLGCGNGELARELAKRGHRGKYLGVDFSLPLLREAEFQPEGFSARFLQVDLTSNNLIDVIARSRETATKQSPYKSGMVPLQDASQSSGYRPSRNDILDVVFSFAVLHHIPSAEWRLNILRTVRELIGDDGKFIHSNWQFLNSEKLKARIQPWEAATLSQSEVDAGDYLLDWRDGGVGLRYVHHFDESELETLAKVSGFRITDTFYSDGEGGRLSMYQIWEPDF